MYHDAVKAYIFHNHLYFFKSCISQKRKGKKFENVIYSTILHCNVSTYGRLIYIRVHAPLFSPFFIINYFFVLQKWIFGRFLLFRKKKMKIQYICMSCHLWIREQIANTIANLTLRSARSCKLTPRDKY